MNIKELRKSTNLTQAAFAKRFNISVRTLQDWEQGRKQPPKYVVSSIKEILIRSNTQDQNNFYVFRSSIQHKIKRNGLQFILDVINDNDIIIYFEMKEYLKCFYLLACIDTLCNEYNIPICEDYDDYRRLQLDKPIYLGKEENCEYLPIFKKYNIYERTIYDAC